MSSGRQGLFVPKLAARTALMPMAEHRNCVDIQFRAAHPRLERQHHRVRPDEPVDLNLASAMIARPNSSFSPSVPAAAMRPASGGPDAARDAPWNPCG